MAVSKSYQDSKFMPTTFFGNICHHLKPKLSTNCAVVITENEESQGSCDTTISSNVNKKAIIIKVQRSNSDSLRAYMEVIKIGRVVKRCSRAITIGNHLNVRIHELDSLVKLHVVPCLSTPI